MIRTAIFFCLVTCAAVAAQAPRAVAEAAIAAWTARDAKSLDALAHPELKKRCREARIIEFYLGKKPEKKQVLVSGSDAEVIELLCEALRAIVPPRDTHLEYFDRYLDTANMGDLAIVRFDSGWKRKTDGVIGIEDKMEIILKKSGGEWKFLWSPSTQLHIDLSWDPTE
jgi:hypothetical protein